MPMWRCPHCATPQAETARCWVCHRPSTACGACRHFRRSVAGNLGYCGMDRQRAPLSGDEIRACWEAADASATIVPALPGIGPVWPLEPDQDRTAVPLLQFVEVPPRAAGPGRPVRTGPAEAAIVTLPTDAEPGWSLWGETEG